MDCPSPHLLDCVILFEFRSFTRDLEIVTLTSPLETSDCDSSFSVQKGCSGFNKVPSLSSVLWGVQQELVEAGRVSGRDGII
jgi:hypothetical protein